MPSVIFPLLRAPQLVIIEILDSMDLSELVSLSFRSRKIRKLIRVCRSKSDLYLCAEHSTHSAIGLSLDCEIQSILNVYNISKMTNFSINNLETVEIEGHKVKFGLDDTGVCTTFWEDEVLGLKLSVEYISDLFKVELHYLIFGNNILSIIDWINDMELLYSAHISSTAIVTDSEYNHFLTNCQSKHLVIDVPPSPRYLFNSSKNAFPEICDVIEIKHGFWMTLDNLMAFNCEEITVGASKFTCLDMNKFIKNWMSGGSPNLRILTILDFVLTSDLFSDIQELVRKFKGSRKIRSHDGRIVFHGSEIKRNDGSVACLMYYRDTRKFLIGIIPNREGNVGSIQL